MDAYETGRNIADKQAKLSLVSITKRELLQICQKNPSHPAALDIVKGVEPYTDDKICAVMPLSLEAIETNREVIVKQVLVQEDGRQKTLRTFELGEKLPQPAQKDDKPTTTENLTDE